MYIKINKFCAISSELSFSIHNVRTSITVGFIASRLRLFRAAARRHLPTTATSLMLYITTLKVTFGNTVGTNRDAEAL